MELSEILPIIAPVIVIQFILIIIALLDLIKRQQTYGPKWMWVLIIVFLNIIGPIIYFLVGRKEQ
jgi:hypothetical protein